MSFVSTKWKTLSKKILLQNKYLNIWEEEVERPDGNISTYYVNRRDPFSIIIPYHEGKLFLTKQFRYSVGALSLEFPMGYVAGKDPRETAVTELKEEAGMVAGELVEIGNFWISVGRSDQIAYVYVANNLEFGEQELEDGEFIEIEEYTIEHVRQMITSGEIKDGPSITSFHYLEEYLKTKDL